MGARDSFLRIQIMLWIQIYYNYDTIFFLNLYAFEVYWAVSGFRLGQKTILES